MEYNDINNNTTGGQIIMNLCIVASIVLLRLLIQEVLMIVEIKSKNILHELCCFTLDSFKHYILLSKIAGTSIITHLFFINSFLDWLASKEKKQILHAISKKYNPIDFQ